MDVKKIMSDKKTSNKKKRKLKAEAQKQAQLDVLFQNQKKKQKKSPSKLKKKVQNVQAKVKKLQEKASMSLVPVNQILTPMVLAEPSPNLEIVEIPRVVRIFVKIFKIVFVLSFILLFVFVAGFTTIYYVFGRDLPDVSQLKTINFAETTTIFDREGNPLYKIFGEENREFLPLNQIDEKILQATIAIEDKNFQSHFGFDPVSIVRAQLSNLKEDATVQGASTITQQLAKNLYLSHEKTLERKIKELILATQIEWNFSKDAILELYLNKIPYGSNSFGVEAAAQTFLGKSAKKVTLIEAVILASLPNGPSRYSPYGANRKDLMGYCGKDPGSNQDESSVTEPDTTEITCSSPNDPNYHWGRKDLVLDRLYQDRLITKEEFQQAWLEGFDVKFKDLKHAIKEPHFVFYVKDYLEKKYGKELVESGGLNVITTLDPKLQKLGHDAIDAHYEQNLKRYGANNGAMVALDPKTGQIVAMIGSKDYWDDSIQGQVNVTTSLRQPGSSFKPLIYAAAIQNTSIGSGSFLNDYKTIFNNNKAKIPNNYDGRFMGRMTIRSALGGSRNVPAIKAFYVAGDEDKILDFMDKIGIKNLREFKTKYNEEIQNDPKWKTKWTFNYGWPLAIGSGEVRLLDLVNAYATLAHQGAYLQANPILEVRDRDGNVLEKFEENLPVQQVMDPSTAFIVTDMLADPMARPAGVWRTILTIPGQVVAAKTGTSDKKVGNSKVSLPNNTVTIGYTTNLVAGFWVGNTDGRPLKNSAYSLYTTDPPWHKFMEEALEGKPKEEFPVPEGIIKVGKEYYPSSWNKKDYDKMFKRADLHTMDCTDAQRKKDPDGCKIPPAPKPAPPPTPAPKPETPIANIKNPPTAIPDPKTPEGIPPSI